MRDDQHDMEVAMKYVLLGNLPGVGQQLEGRKREQRGVAKQRAGHELRRRHGRDRKTDQRDQRRVETM